jgi:hypothetical protein
MDEETLRSAVALFAEAHADMHVTVPAALPEKPAKESLRSQLEALTAAQFAAAPGSALLVHFA